MVGAGAGDQGTGGAKHFQGAQVQFLVAPEGGIEVMLGLRKGGRIEGDCVVALSGNSVVLKQVESVGFDPLDAVAIQRGVPVSHFEGGPGTVDAGGMGATRGHMKGKASLVAEDVESFAVSILGSGGIVLALVKEGSSLLTLERVEMELDVVHGEDGRGFFTLDKS